MPAKGFKKQYCKNKHDTFICGRSKNGACKDCVSIARKKRHKNEYKPHPPAKKQFCLNGHDTFICGRNSNNNCVECLKEKGEIRFQEIKKGIRIVVHKTQFCPQGHDKDIIGRDAYGRCLKCLEYIPVEVNKKIKFCSKDHDKDIVGRTSDGHCKICTSDYHKRILKMTRKARREHSLKVIYGISTEDFNGRLANQNNVCLGCLRSPLEFDRAFAVDHDHKCCPGKRSCGKCIRGLLCGPCNSILGMAKDSKDTLIRLANYLEKRYTK